MRVLVTDSNNQNTLAIVRRLGAAGHTVEVVGSWPHLAGRSRYAAARRDFPEPVDRDAFGEALVALLKQERFDALVPVGFQSVLAVAAIRERVRNLVPFAIADDESLAIAAEKSRTLEFCEGLGVSTPRSLVARNSEEASAAADQIGYPVVLKPVVEGIRPKYASDPDTLRSAVGSLLSKQRKILVQELVKGRGYGYFGLYDRGKRLLHFTHRRRREYPATGGASTAAESVRENELVAAGEAVLSALKWRGVAMVEFKRRESDGTFIVMEINPKFWGSLELALFCGVDFVSGAMALARGEEIPLQPDYSAGRRFQWPVPGDFLHCLQRPKDFPTFFADLFNPKVGKDVRLLDPGPLWVQIGKLFYRWTQAKR